MKAIRNLILVLTLLGGAQAFSQSFEVPQGYGFTTAEDYTRYEKDIIAAAKWLESTPLNAQRDKRKQATDFIFRWVNGSPTVTVNIYPCILDFDKANPGMLALYMAACSRYVLENNYSKDDRAAQAAALRSMMKLYQIGTGVARDKKMEKLIKTDAEGKLDKWLEKTCLHPKADNPFRCKPEPMPAPTTIDAYIATFPESTQKLLQQVRTTIRKAAPGATETISYGICAFRLHERILIYFAGFKKHIGMYPVPSGNPELDKAFEGYKTSGRGTIQFPLDKPLPVALITRIVKFRMEDNATREAKKQLVKAAAKKTTAKTGSKPLKGAAKKKTKTGRSR